MWVFCNVHCPRCRVSNTFGLCPNSAFVTFTTQQQTLKVVRWSTDLIALLNRFEGNEGLDANLQLGEKFYYKQNPLGFNCTLRAYWSGGLVVWQNINASIDPLHLHQLNLKSCRTFVYSSAISVYLLVLLSKKCWTCVCVILW